MTEPRIAVVTGGSRGIGAATATALAAQGWDVAISYRERAAEAGEVVAACTGTGRRALAVRADVAAEADVVRLFETVHERLGPIGAVVNNAGVVSPSGRVAEYDVARLEQVFRINSVGAFLVAREAVRRMSTTYGGAGGVIVNVSSRAAVLGSAGEYVDWIRVVGVRPGLIETEIHAPGRLERLGSSPPLGRPGRAEEVAAAIAWLASDQASYVTGTTLDVSGGR